MAGVGGLVNGTILVIDDEAIVREALKLVIEPAGFIVELVSSAQEGLRLARKSPTKYLAAFVDFQLVPGSQAPEDRGDFVAKRLKEINPDLDVTIVSGDLSSEAFRAWANSGVDRYLYKPLDPENILTVLECAVARHKEKSRFADESSGPCLDDKSQSILRKVNLIGASRSLVEVAKDTLKFAPKNNTILIFGETGSGKERVAGAIHENSPRKRAPFIAINCAAYKGDTNLLESELFGYEKGAFTGANQANIGVFEAANGGTVFLDEIHHLSHTAQAKLLRVVQEKKVRRVGGKVELKVDFRIVVAAKPNLRSMVESGDFSPDLYFRLKDLVINIPPLRERVDDIKPLIFYFRSEIEKREGVHKEFEDACIERLRSYSWPGNVRELERVIGQLYAKIDGSVIRVSHLPEEIIKPPSLSLGDQHQTGEKFVTLGLLSTQYEKSQRELIVKVLRHVRWNVSKAAEILGVPRTSLNSLIKKFQIDDPSEEMAKKIQSDRRSWLGLGRRDGEKNESSIS